MTRQTATDRNAAGGVAPGWLVVVLLAGAGIRLFGLGATDLWGDEAFSVMTALGSPRRLIGLLSSGEPHPPLYPFVLAVWLRIAGSSEFVARLPSAFAGIGSIAVAARLASALAPRDDRRAAGVYALVASLLVAVNPFQVWYSQEARMYAQINFFAGLATLLLLRLRGGTRWAVPAYAAAVAAAAGSHYYGLFVPIAHGLSLLLLGKADRPTLRRWLVGSALAGACYLPWVFVARQVFSGYLASPAKLADLVPVAISAGVRVTAGWSLDWQSASEIAIGLGLAAGVGALAPTRSQADRRLRIVLLLWLVTPFALAFALSLVHPLLNERYLIVSSLPFILLIARGIGWLWTKPMPIGAPAPRALAQSLVPAAIGIAILAGALTAAYAALGNVWAGKYVKSTYSVHTRAIDTLARGGEAVILNGPVQEPLYRYYARQQSPSFTLPRRDPIDAEATRDELDRIAAGHPGAWVIWYANTLYDPRNVIGGWLTSHAYLSLDDFAGNARLQYYSFAPDATLATQPTHIALGDELTLSNYQWTGADPRAGDTLAIKLCWRTRANAPSDDYRVSLRLVDPAGFIWGQTDQSVSQTALETDPATGDRLWDDRHGLRVPAGTPPGDYTLMLVVARSGTSTPLSPSGSGAPIVPGGIRLARIHVATPARALWPGEIDGLQPTNTAFGEGLTLLGHAGGGAVSAGAAAYVTLVWQSTRQSPSVSNVRFELRTPDGRLAQTTELPMPAEGYQPARWQPGDIIRGQYRLAVGAGLPAGDYEVFARPLPADATTAAIRLGSLHVDANREPAASPPASALDARIGTAFRLQGYTLAGRVLRRGQPVRLTLSWASEAPTQTDYLVFVHVLDSANRVVAQRDQQPAAGARPTSGWLRGDAIGDAYAIELPASLPPGQYTLEVGMYNPTTGVRLPVTIADRPAGDQVELDTIQVEP